MKFTITSICVILMTIHASQSSRPLNVSKNDRRTLNQIYGKIVNGTSKASVPEAFKKFLESPNLDCIKEQMKLAEHGDKEMYIDEVNVIVIKALTKCSEHDGQNFFRLLIQENLDKFAKNDQKCAKLKLHRQNSQSKFIANFNAESMTEEDKTECVNQANAEDVQIRSKIADRIGTDDVAAITCGHFETDELKIVFQTFALLANENDAEVKNSETENLAAYLVGKVDKIYDCLFARLN